MNRKMTRVPSEQDVSDSRNRLKSSIQLALHLYDDSEFTDASIKEFGKKLDDAVNELLISGQFEQDASLLPYFVSIYLQFFGRISDELKQESIKISVETNGFNNVLAALRKLYNQHYNPQEIKMRDSRKASEGVSHRYDFRKSMAKVEVATDPILIEEVAAIVNSAFADLRNSLPIPRGKDRKTYEFKRSKKEPFNKVGNRKVFQRAAYFVPSDGWNIVQFRSMVVKYIKSVLDKVNINSVIRAASFVQKKDEKFKDKAFRYQHATIYTDLAGVFGDVNQLKHGEIHLVVPLPLACVYFHLRLHHH